MISSHSRFPLAVHSVHRPDRYLGSEPLEFPEEPWPFAFLACACVVTHAARISTGNTKISAGLQIVYALFQREVRQRRLFEGKLSVHFPRPESASRIHSPQQEPHEHYYDNDDN